MYLWVEVDNGKVHIHADVPPESPTVRGFISLLARSLDGAAPDAHLVLEDTARELANMVAGNFKNKIDGMSDKCLLSVPTVITGADYSFRSISESQPLELWFRFHGKALHIALELHP